MRRGPTRVADDMFSFDAGNRTLMFKTAFFAAEPEAVLMVKWGTDIKQGASVHGGTLLGEVIFNDGSKKEMRCPVAVAGVIAATNRRVELELLSEPPAQFALRLT